jgi:hypothetical protein
MAKVDGDAFKDAYEDMLKDAVQIQVGRSDTGEVVFGGDTRDVPLKRGQRGQFILVPLPGVVNNE